MCATLLRSRLERLVAEGGYRGTLVRWIRATCDWTVMIVMRTADRAGVAVLPTRWVVERTCAWLGNDRWLSKDSEGRTEVSEAFVSVAMIHLMRGRFTR